MMGPSIRHPEAFRWVALVTVPMTAQLGSAVRARRAMAACVHTRAAPISIVLTARGATAGPALPSVSTIRIVLTVKRAKRRTHCASTNAILARLSG